ncbi:MAG: hypothetical protein ACRD6W_12415 [Nitrososphaerales archaeon]
MQARQVVTTVAVAVLLTAGIVYIAAVRTGTSAPTTETSYGVITSYVTITNYSSVTTTSTYIVNPMNFPLVSCKVVVYSSGVVYGNVTTRTITSGNVTTTTRITNAVEPTETTTVTTYVTTTNVSETASYTTQTASADSPSDWYVTTCTYLP